MAAASESAPLLRVPLRKRRALETDGDELRAHRMSLERERVRRRAQESEDEDEEEEGDGNPTGALAFSEAPLRVGYGTHYAEIYMGIPAQRASVIVDTGSHLTALPCSTCADCGQHTDPLFDVSKSTTAKYLTCSAFGSCSSCEQDRCYISQSYTEGSMWHAVVVDELVWVGGFTGGKDADAVLRHFGVRFPLGCQTKETGLFVTQKENGIMGMGRHSATVLAHLLRAGRLEHEVFSLCFARDGGEMVLGGVDYSHHTTAVAYTPLLASTASFYRVRVKDLRVGGRSIGASERELNSGKGVIVDSGTTDTFFVSSASRDFLSAFRDASGGVQYSESKMLLTADEVRALPAITVVLAAMDGDSEDVELQIPADKYLTPSDNGKFFYGNVHFSERSGGVLGASSMIGLDVIFDAENQRVGFAESRCGEGAAAWQDATLAGESNGDDSALGNTTSSSSGGVTAVFDASSPDGAIARRSSPSAGVFMAEVLVITLVGVLVGVVLWARRQRRKRSWAAIPEVDSSRGASDGEAMGSSSVAAGTGSPSSDVGRRRDDEGEELPQGTARALSPPLSAASSRKGPSPRFTIGSDDEDDDIVPERTEL